MSSGFGGKKEDVSSYGLWRCDRGHQRLVEGRFAQKRLDAKVTGMGARTRAIAGKAFGGTQREIDVHRQGPAV